MPDEAELEQRFQVYYGAKVERVPEIFERNRDGVLKLLARVLQQRKRAGHILDIGCGSGYFLARFFAVTGWHRWGNEICEETASMAEASGIRVARGDFLRAGFEEGAFDAVCVLDTFYYFPDPLTVLREIHRVLKPGGVVLIELPFAPTRLWRVAGKANRMDLFYYSPRPVVRLLKEALFGVEQIVPLPANRQYGMMRNLFYTMYSWGTRAIWTVSLHRWMTAPRFAVMAVKG